MTTENLSTRVLVADDEPINRMLMAELLEEHGIACEEAEDGHAALARVRGETFDLVFLDLSMPGLDGTDVCRQLRADPATRGLYLVAYTAHAFSEHLREILEHGFDTVLTKPVSGQQLARVLLEYRAAGGISTHGGTPPAVAGADAGAHRAHP